jgi:hypothetical protein
MSTAHRVVPIAQPAYDPMLEYGAVLSPSQVSSWIDCQAKWYFHYMRGLQEKPSASLAFGTALHTALGANFRAKGITGEDMPADDVVAEFQEAWTAESEQASFRHNQDPATYAAQGAQLVRQYLADVAPQIMPATLENGRPAVEVEVSGQIGGVNARGFIDVIDTNGRIIDLKSASRTNREIKPGHVSQLAAYRILGPDIITGDCRIDQLIRKKDPEILPLEHQITNADMRLVRTIYPIAQAQMRSGLYIPNREANYCSRSQCGYWHACMQDFGGSVPV